MEFMLEKILSLEKKLKAKSFTSQETLWSQCLSPVSVVLSGWEPLTPLDRTLFHHRLAPSRRLYSFNYPRRMESWFSLGGKEDHTKIHISVDPESNLGPSSRNQRSYPLQAAVKCNWKSWNPISFLNAVLFLLKKLVVVIVTLTLYSEKKHRIWSIRTSIFFFLSVISNL